MNRFIFVCTAVFLYYAPAKSFSLDSTITRSDSCVAVQWSPDSLNTSGLWYAQYGDQCTGNDTIYRHCDFIAGRTYRGIAYSYGGEDPWFTFRNHLAAGYLVGSHQCHYNVFGDPSGRVTGTDCSGFLCFVWNIARTTTTDLYNNKNFITVPIANVQAGDALVKATSLYGFHAILIVEAEDPSEVVISEASSTVFGCRQRVIDLTRAEWEPYKLLRNPALQRQQIAIVCKAIVPKFKIVRSGSNQIIVYLNNPEPAQLSGYDLDGTILFKKQLDGVNFHYIALPSESSRVIYLSLQANKTIRTVRIPLF
jgi:hypothetical protein